MKEEKTKKKFNKKLLTFGLLGIFALALVSAGVYLYVGSASVTGIVDEPLSVLPTPVLFSAYAGETRTANVVVGNLADVPLTVKVSYVETSNEVLFNLDNSAGTCDNWETDPLYKEDCEKRIILLESMPLSTLTSISWDVDGVVGYIAHVDVIIDIDGKLITTTDDVDALVFEYAKVNPDLGCDEGIANYPTGNDINTFGDKGIVNSDAKAWLNSGPAGPCAETTVTGDMLPFDGLIFEDTYKSLAEWKIAYPDAKIVRFELEVDNWIATSSSEVSNIVINGNEIKVDYDMITTGEINIPIGGKTINVAFLVDGASPVGEFAGVINVERV